MSLTPGERLGPYEILSQIGAGGMGEVYKARDTRLDRVVALKTSKQQFTERFEREARAVAQLNHPNVCTLHDVGPNFLVMEFVEGASPKGPLPLDEALRIARQIVAALEAAHEKHITHRDLKPGNVMVKPDGQVKVLDFGLAKLAPPPRTDLHPENSPTLTMSMTEAGMVVGTAAYMSPEQAKGINVDKRADIWAFGVVLYELLTGKRPFQGNDIAEILASVIKEQPSYDAVPFEVRRMIQRCLEKDPAKRLRDIGDVWDLLDKPEAPSPAPVVVEAKPSRLPWAVAAFAGLAAGVAGWLHFAQPTPEPPSAVRMELTPPDPSATMMTLSPDGKSIMFLSLSEGIWIRALDSALMRHLAGTEKPDMSAFWSADSRSIAFRGSGTTRLRRIDVSGGPPATITEGAGFRNGSWNRDGVLIGGSAKGILRASAAGGAVTLLTTVDPKLHLDHHSPMFLPDGKRFVYMANAADQSSSSIYWGSIDDTPDQQPKAPLIASAQPGTQANRVYYAAGPDPDQGYLLFRRDDTVIAQPFNTAALQVTGEPMPVSDSGAYYFSATATALTYGTQQSNTSQLTWFDRSGKQTGLVGEAVRQAELSLSPDGMRVALWRSVGIGKFPLWTLGTGEATETRITADTTVAATPVWSSDGVDLIYSLRGGSDSGFYRTRADGAGQPELILQLQTTGYPLNWTPDGTLFYVQAPGDFWTLDLKTKGAKPVPYLATPAIEVQGQLSPDGRWVAYTSDESGRNEIYVRPFPDSSKGKTPVSTNGGNQPRWSRDGKELLYVAADNTFTAVAYTATSTFVVKDRKPLFKAPVLRITGTDKWGIGWDIAPDGRFLVNTNTQGEGAGPITVVLNWQSLLKK